MMKKKVIINTSTFVSSSEDKTPSFINSMVESLNLEYEHLEIVVLRPMRDINEKTYIEKNYKVIPYRYFWPISHQNLFKVGLSPAYEKNKLNIFKIFSLFIAQFFAIIRVIRTEKPDYIYCQWLIPQALVTALAVKIFPTKFYFSTYGADVLIVKNIKFIGRGLVRFIVNSADKFTAISKLNYSLIEESFYPRKIDASKGKIIPLPIDNFFFEVKNFKKSPENNFLSIGRLVPVKGLDLLIDSIAQIDKDMKFKLDILGEGIEKENLVRKVKNENLENIVFFHGWQNNEEKIDFISDSDVVFITSIQSKSTMEGGPIALIEALSQKKVVICSDSVGYADHIENGFNGIKFQSGDITSLKKAIDFYLKLDIKDKLRIQENAYKLSLKFKRDTITKDLYSYLFS